MDFRSWNSELGSAFLDEGPGQPVYFAVTEPELRRLNDHRDYGIDDPVADLQLALRPYSFRTFGDFHRRWERDRSLDFPPWLPFLAATTIVVDQQAEKGSTSFYDPLGEFLGTQVSRDDYEDTFALWWPALKRWLEDDERHAGRRGFATWGSIPRRGMRCVIGHPYTQILLRREERGQVDDFITEFDHDSSTTPPIARDREKVALHLVSAFRRWARHRRAVSARLRRVLENPQADESLSLGYVLLGRLFDEISGQQWSTAPGSAVRIVPAFDDYERVARLVAVAPSWVSAREPISIPGADASLREPGERVAIERPITAEVLERGLELELGTTVRLIPRDRYVLAARDFALWCEVEGALPGEKLHILIRTPEARRLALEVVPSVSGLPDGWAICGPLTIDDLPAGVQAVEAASGRRLAPRLMGGLRLQPRVYLAGGEPTLELPDHAGAVAIDGVVHTPIDGSVHLSGLGLSAGRHTAEVDGFELPFESISSLARPEPRPTLGRDHTGAVVPLNERSKDSDLVTGARRYPQEEEQRDPYLFPRPEELVKLGAPGQVAVFNALTLASWARTFGLPHLAIELYQRTTYPHGDRAIIYPWWIAWRDMAGAWTIAELAHDRDGENDALADPEAWYRQCHAIGAAPQVWSDRRDTTDATAVLARWRDYVRTEVERG